jgi:hypothetical protein
MVTRKQEGVVWQVVSMTRFKVVGLPIWLVWLPGGWAWSWIGGVPSPMFADRVTAMRDCKATLDEARAQLKRKGKRS